MSLSVEIIFESDSNNDELTSTITKAAYATEKEIAITDKEVGILICDNKKIQQLNRDFRKKDKPTNVLSFEGEGEYIGDIAISLEYIIKEADEENKTLENHLSHMVIHGILHLNGYDHEEDKEAEIMESLEAKILKNL